ncbi:IpaD/SipD/SspD family type III secretion system needle tip protein [Erwinia tracheiphila]|uniref:IpaD/SipD/SspD family type III secretion system needle tip protein n=1 Tax=Erwinia tracheiphila TaxID=65700 RepID=UPI0003355ED2|nr:IpaD/SipD/SspD family type III secretion system needle tip protein [Erwinia tracheiphila]EOS94407.1 type III secretion system protein [Erwinia tracheiphila PSU-1]UIA88083.1 IpaD/SipD/SspD family type III secretion system needle tip protein [Erwinia tracheiphila]UIA96676.1 IpaD/SipD/SspD family type III secretion system needle tip protein [Erwinia tracheiphila]
MTELNNSVKIKMPNIFAMQTGEDKTMLSSSTEQAHAAKRTQTDNNYDTVKPDLNPSWVVKFFLAMAPAEKKGNYTFSDTHEKMQKLDFLLSEIDIKNDSIPEKKIDEKLENIARAYQCATSSGVDASELITNQENIFSSFVDSIDELKNTVRDQSLTVEKDFSHIKSELLQARSNNSHAELADGISNIIDSIKENYLDQYTYLMKLDTDLYQAYNEIILAASAQAVSGGSDGNEVRFNGPVMLAAYEKFQKKIEALERDLGHVNGWDTMDAAARENAKTLLAPAFNVDDAGKITFNLGQYDSSPKYPNGITFTPAFSTLWPASASSKNIPTTSYQAWLAAFNSVGTALQSNMQAFSQRYSQAVSTFNNLSGLMVNNVSTLADSIKEFLRNLS